ncbi:MAG: zinc-ribbon domain-containing protein [Phycisphaerales bacterium]
MAKRSTFDSDEEPSSDDLARFGHETAYCPHCGAEVWDDAHYCSSCEQSFTIASSYPPASARARKVWRAVFILLALIGLVILAVVL